MKIVLLTPTIVTSAIGRVSTLQCTALRNLGHDVTIVRTEIPAYLEETSHSFGVDILPWTDDARVRPLLDEADLKVYQIGNNYEFHAGGLHWLESHPGIVCIHDFFLGHLFWAWSSANPNRATDILTRWYGAKVAETYFHHDSSESFIKATSDAAPMTEWVSAMATGVITHSKWGLPHVTRACRGPVMATPLCYNILKAPDVSPARSGSPLNFQLLTIGHVNANKRVRSVLLAIGYSALLRERITYRLVGRVEPHVADELKELAERLDVKLVISGEADDDTLSAAIADADAVSCLRWPTLEAASASLIEALLNGKVTLVTDTGFYSELPGDLVRKVDPYNEIPEIQAILEDMVRDPEGHESMATQAQTWAQETFSAENYARSLLELHGQSRKAAPLIDANRYFTDVLARWGAPPEMAQQLL